MAREIEVGDVMGRAFAVGKVIRSRNSDFAPGDCVMGLFGWQELAAVRADEVLLRITEQNSRFRCSSACSESMA